MASLVTQTLDLLLTLEEGQERFGTFALDLLFLHPCGSFCWAMPQVEPDGAVSQDVASLARLALRLLGLPPPKERDELLRLSNNGSLNREWWLLLEAMGLLSGAAVAPCGDLLQVARLLRDHLDLYSAVLRLSISDHAISQVEYDRLQSTQSALGISPQRARQMEDFLLTEEVSWADLVALSSSPDGRGGAPDRVVPG